MSELRTPEEKVVTGCEWERDDDFDTCQVWTTSCGKEHAFLADGPIDNEFKFCPFCGLALDQLPYSEPEDDSDFCEETLEMFEDAEREDHFGE